MLFVRLAAIVLGLLAIAAPALAAPPPVEAYGKLPAVEQVRLSPSGQRYAFIAVIGEQRRLVAVTADGETPQQRLRRVAEDTSHVLTQDIMVALGMGVSPPSD